MDLGFISDLGQDYGILALLILNTLGLIKLYFEGENKKIDVKISDSALAKEREETTQDALSIFNKFFGSYLDMSAKQVEWQRDILMAIQAGNTQQTNFNQTLTDFLEEIKQELLNVTQRLDVVDVTIKTESKATSDRFDRLETSLAEALEHIPNKEAIAHQVRKEIERYWETERRKMTEEEGKEDAL